MKIVLRVAALLAVVCCVATSAFGQGQQIVCDLSCSPDPGSSNYSPNVVSRVKQFNARGHALTKSPATTVERADAAAVDLIGSQSYDYAVPIVHLPGRAGLDLNLTLRYNSRVWDVNSDNATVTFNTDRDFPSYGFRLDFGYLETDTANGGYILTESDGTKHQLEYFYTTVYGALDGSHIEFDTSTNRAYYPNGVFITYAGFPSQGASPTLFRPTAITDTNGNYISIAYRSGHDQEISTITDTLGRQVTFNYDANSPYLLLNVTEQLSGSSTFTLASFQWGTTNLTYSFSGLTVKNTQANNTSINVLTRVTLPDSTYHTFTYGDWGIVNRIDRYSNNGTRRSYTSYNFPNTTTALSDAPGYSTETVSPDGSATYTWSYSTTKSGNTVTATSVTDPTGAITSYSLLSGSDPCAGAVSYMLVTDSGSNPLRRVDYSYDSDCNVSEAVTTLSDTSQKSKIDYTYDTHGNVTDEKVYDWGSGSPGGLLRETVTDFESPANFIVNLPNKIQVKNSAGTVISRTDFGYDQTTPSSPNGGGTPSQHGTPAGSRKNLTSVTRYTNASAGSGSITRNFGYDELGNLITADLDCCNQKTWTYTSTTQWAYPDSIVRGPSGTQVSTSYTYDFYTGFMSSSTDENGKQTQYSADGARRLHIVTQPNTVTITTVYDDASAQPSVTQSTSANSSARKSIFDGLGRLVEDQSLNGSTLVSKVSYQYDGLGRQTFRSNPYSSGAALNTETRYDAVGRVTTVLPPGSVGNYTYSYYGNTVVTSDPAGKQRRNITDALGRLTEVDEPELTTGVTITGTEQSHTDDTSTHATGTVNVGGTEQYLDQGTWYCAMWEDPDTCIDWEYRPNLVYDTGRVNVTVNGHTDFAYYNSGSDATSVTADLVSTINGDSGSYVTAAQSGTTITLTSKGVGSGTNYSLSVSYASDDPTDFNPPSFYATTGGNATQLSGGVTGSNTTYDTGTVSVTVNGFTKSVTYNSGDNTNSIASNLASAFASDPNSPVNAAPSGNTIVFTATSFSGNTETVSTGHSTNYPQYFSSASYSANGTALSASLSPGAPTYYQYRATGELTSVADALSGAVQTRTYAYDDLGRVTSTTLPESGYTQYSYTDFSSVYQRTDARGVVTTYTYDGLHRPYQISYNVGSTGVANPGAVTFTYGTSSSSNNVNRLYQMTDGTGSETYTYDSMGRVSNLAKVLSGITYNTGYSYNDANQVTQITYPSSRAVGQTFDAIGRLSTITNNSATVLGSLNYNEAGQPTSFSYGNGVSASMGYNDHLQIQSLSYSSGATTLLSLTYSYLDGNSHNNGQIQGITDSRGPVYSTSYAYDPLGRLSQARTSDLSSASTWCLNWSYDRYGNRLSQSSCGGTLSVYQPQLQASKSTNRISAAGYLYDANGNLTNDTVHTYAYDAENRLVSVDSGSHTYAYDGNGLRVRKDTIIYVFSGANAIAEYPSGGSANSPSTEYLYSDRGLVATVAGAAITYHHPDHLSNRVETNSSASTMRTFAHLPFGDIWYETGTADKWKMTGDEHDSEANQEHTWFRQYSSVQGRWTRPDPAGLAATELSNPQSLNQYAYVLNSPSTFVDPYGLDEKGNAPDLIWYCIDGVCKSYTAGSTFISVGPNDPVGSPFDGRGSVGGETQGMVTVAGAEVSGGSGGGSNSNGSGGHPAPGCLIPSSAQSRAISILRTAASFYDRTIGVGLGGSGGAGLGLGVGLYATGSAQLIVSPNGQAAMQLTYAVPGVTYKWVTVQGPKGWGALGGAQFSVSNAKSPSDLAGKAVDASGSVGAGLGAGADISLGSGGVVQGTVTLGFGLGGRGGAGAVTETAIIPFCHP